MLTATATPDANRGATLFARIPQALGEAERRLRYDEPLNRWAADHGLSCSLRGFTLPIDNNGSGSVGIEVRAESVEPLALIVQEIANLGAPRETLIEIESDKATVEFSLTEAEGT